MLNDKNKKEINDMIKHPAEKINYWDYDKDKILTCPICGWKGKPGDNIEYYDQLFDVTCPECQKMILIVQYPNAEETMAAAEAGNKNARKHLSIFEIRDAYMDNYEENKLKSRKDLPDFKEKNLHFIFDVAHLGRSDDYYTVISCNNEIIWMEPGLYESWFRFNEIRKILERKYRDRVKTFKPTVKSEFYLYGDDLASPSKIRIK